MLPEETKMMNLSLYTELRKEYIKTWRIWYAMNQRCDPVWRKKYGNCGSKCVFEIVDEWSREEFGEEGFINFFDCVGDLEHVSDLHRKDPTKPYGPKNWIKGDPYTRTKHSRYYTSDKAKAMRKAKQRGIPGWLFYARVNKHGWSLRKASTVKWTPCYNR